MSGIRFTREQQMLLSKNPCVVKVTEKSITYSEIFKISAIKAYAQGKKPAEIFRDAGFDLNIIGNENPGRSLDRWKNRYFISGEAGLTGEKRGNGGTGRPKSSELTLEERLMAAEAKVAYLEMENEFLKKLDELERRNAKK